eukprot:3759516-Pleurochrysis_carterae.AAC.2
MATAIFSHPPTTLHRFSTLTLIGQDSNSLDCTTFLASDSDRFKIASRFVFSIHIGTASTRKQFSLRLFNSYRNNK